MFRELARKKQKLSEADCIEVLSREPRGVLSVLGDDGYPYGMPMNFWYCPEDGKIYFHTGKVGHRLDALKACDKASFCVYDAGEERPGDWGLYVRSVIVFGRVEIIEDHERAIQITRDLSYKYTDDGDYIEDEIRKGAANVLVIALVPEHMTGKLVHEA